MHKWPKCSSRYSDDVKICRTCGAILEAVAEEPPQAADNDPSPHQDENQTTSAEQSSWKCSQCGQSVPGIHAIEDPHNTWQLGQNPTPTKKAGYIERGTDSATRPTGFHLEPSAVPMGADVHRLHKIQEGPRPLQSATQRPDTVQLGTNPADFLQARQTQRRADSTAQSPGVPVEC